MSASYEVTTKTATSSNWFKWEGLIRHGVTISAAARDDANTPTTTIRSGKAMGIITATKLALENDATASDGSEVFAGILLEEVNLLDSDGNARNVVASLAIGGTFKSSVIEARADTNFSLANAKLENKNIRLEPFDLFFD